MISRLTSEAQPFIPRGKNLTKTNLLFLGLKSNEIEVETLFEWYDLRILAALPVTSVQVFLK